MTHKNTNAPAGGNRQGEGRANKEQQQRSEYSTPRPDAYAAFAELALLSAITNENHLLADCGILVEHAEWFYSDAHHAVAQTLFERLAQGRPIDMMLLWEALQQTGRRNRVGVSPHDLADIVGQANALRTSAGVQEYAAQIIACAEERRRYQWAQRVAAKAFASGAELQALLDARETDLAQFHEGAQAALPAQTARDLMSKVIPAPRWAVPNLFAEGLNILAGKPKKGKSTLALQVCKGVAKGSMVLGQIEVMQGEALYLALEDTERRMQRRLEPMLDHDGDGNAIAPDDFYIRYDWRRLDAGGIDDLDQWIHEHERTRLIVIDTWARVKPRQTNKNATLYEIDYDSLAPLQHWAIHTQVAVVLIVHLRKAVASADDVIDEISGSTGLTAAADNIVVMRKDGGVTSLHRQGRDYSDDDIWALQGNVDTLLWTIQGDLYDVKRSAERTEILNALATVGGWRSPKEIAALVRQPNNRIRALLKRWVDSGDIALRYDPVTHLYAHYKESNTPNSSNTPNTPYTSRDSSSVTGVTQEEHARVTLWNGADVGHAYDADAPVTGVRGVTQESANAMWARVDAQNGKEADSE